MESLPPLSLYIHYPWCVRKCPYCDFNSHTLKQESSQQRYLQALIDDLSADLPAVWGRPIESIFFGGGTPSLIEPELLADFISQLRALLNLKSDTEITLEANPGTAEQQRFHAFRDAGINRLSIGIQSFDDHKLTALGRIHSGQEAVEAVEMARQAGFNSINLDLMFGLPGQSLDEAANDLAQAIALKPEHISYYQLTIEPNTAFAHAPPVCPDDDTLWLMQQQGIEQLANSGFIRYEVSAYAQKGGRCRHNLNYWHFGDYLGIGAGAHGKISSPQPFRVERLWKQRHPDEYIGSSQSAQRVSGHRSLSREDLILEFMMNALRLNDGFDESLFELHTGLSLDEISRPLASAIEEGMIRRDGGRIIPTDRGIDYLNDLLQLFAGD
ncbi:MAG: radical SAM family heme chaperone HemW [Gammaproteobacteria bacterium]|nr:radical SAM family heme chaperone HemW [Gammaproteobacteria bacterium]